MGLELIKYFLAIENAFEQDIPDDELVKLETPLRLIDYLCARLGETSDGAQLTQVAFYRLRAALADELAVSRRDIRPTSSVVELAPHYRFLFDPSAIGCRMFRDLPGIWQVASTSCCA